ncbi:MAG: carboxypeptidase M32 [Planctomycetota bacterium]
MTTENVTETEHEAITDLREHLRKIALISHASTVLSWDQETHMPSSGGGVRAEALGELAGIAHERSQQPALGECIERAEEAAFSSGDETLQALVREVRHDYERSLRIPVQHATESAEVNSKSIMAWQAAREQDDFSAFEPMLSRQIELQKAEAEYLRDDEDCLYDVLMNKYERGMTSANFSEICRQVVPGLKEIIDRVVARALPEPEFFRGPWEKNKQLEFSKEVATQLGYDLDKGGLDLTSHPFCTSPVAPFDVRITTRVYEDNFTSNLYGVIHEAGHAMYEQGFEEKWVHTPLCDAISLGIHESQSRFWENDIGRTEAFWVHFLPLMKKYFPRILEDVSANDMALAVNPVKPSLIRVDADEVTYGLHIALRFEVEQALFSGDLQVADLPSAWNEKMESYLGLTPPNFKDGVLQDIHWSFGAFGYFPTYLLGSLYSAQFHQAISEEIDIDQEVAAGRFGEILDWLRERIHRPGRQFMPLDLLERAVGKGLDPAIFVDHLDRKVQSIHGV